MVVETNMEKSSFRMMAAGLLTSLCTFAATASTLYFAGDSTLDDAGYSHGGRIRFPYYSWGTELQKSMKAECRVSNFARSGASTKSFLKSGQWAKLIAEVKEGDFVAIQFGHNDQKRSSDFYLNERWADPKGLFREIVRGWVGEVRAKGATPILLSPICRGTFDKDGKKLVDATHAFDGVCLGSYRDAMKELSAELGCDYVDMNGLTRELMERVGRDEAMKFFVISTGLAVGKDGEPSHDVTHPCRAGAEAFAKLFVENVVRRGLPVAELFEDFAGSALNGVQGKTEGSPKIDPLTTRWTFGAHEPFTMYRRVGRICTGAIDGNAKWVGDWLDWFDRHGPEKMEEMGFNFLHSRFYKGMGWEVEKKDFPNVKRFVANCHAHGVRALAYVQFGTLYPETLRREIPQVDSWAGVSETGGPSLYCGMYFRWMPCLNCREWEDCLKRMCTIALTEGGFDGIMFDNVFDAPCYCLRCEKAFREHLKSVPDRRNRFGIEDLDHVLLPRIRLSLETKLEVQDPVAQEWLRWRSDVMTGVVTRLRDHIKQVKPDAIVSGNPSPYRDRAEALYKAQNMAELCRAFDFIIMQNANFPEVWADGVIRNRARDLKFAQDMGQRVVALCDNVECLSSDQEAKFLLPMVEDIVFGGIPTDRTSIFPSPEPGYVDRKVFESRKPLHRRFNAFAAAHAEELSAPTVHSVRIFYPEREIYLSERDHQGVVAAEEILLRNRVPYGYLVSSPDDVMTVPKGTEVVVVPGLVALSAVQVEALVTYAKSGGKLVVTGDAGRYDDWIAQYRVNPFLPQVRGLANVVCRAEADVIPNAVMGWGYTVPPPADGGVALMEDLRKVGWKAPVEFEGLPPHVFAEYRKLPSGALAVHLINYDPAHVIGGARVVLPTGKSATAEEPLGADLSVHVLSADGVLPPFAEYLLVVVK